MENFGKFCFGIIMLAASAIIGGFVFMTLWGWFIAPVFNMQYLSLIQCVGITFFINSLRKVEKSGTTTINEQWLDMASRMLYNAIGLCLGWLIHLFY